jgi:hypothetical protein
MSYWSKLLAYEAREQRKQDIQAERLHKSLAGQLKPSDTKILERLRVQSNEIIQRV